MKTGGERLQPDEKEFFQPVYIAPDKSSSDIDVGAELTGKRIKTGIVLIAPDKSSSDIDVGVELTGKQIRQVLYTYLQIRVAVILMLEQS